MIKKQNGYYAQALLSNQHMQCGEDLSLLKEMCIVMFFIYILFIFKLRNRILILDC